MKIGILTFHRAINYGAVLQCYALYEVLRKMGHDVEVIDYRPPYIEKYRKVFYWNDFKKTSLRSKIKSIILLPFNLFCKRETIEAFDSFLGKHLSFSSIVKKKTDIPNCYDVIVFGSDQIWSPRICEGFDPIFWGDFTKGKTRFVTYAPSLEGFDCFSDEKWAYIIHNLNNFDTISVREESFKVELMKRSTYNICNVLDPTLIISSELLEKIAVSPNMNNYILLFTVQGREIAYSLAKKIANEFKYKIICVTAQNRFLSNDLGNDVCYLKGLTPEQFLGLVNNAKLVITNSFHATAISIQMKTEFVCVKCPRPKRIINILNTLGISERYISDINDFDLAKKIDYSTVNTKLQKLARDSRSYLERILINMRNNGYNQE